MNFFLPAFLIGLAMAAVGTALLWRADDVARFYRPFLPSFFSRSDTMGSLGIRVAGTGAVIIGAIALVESFFW